MLNIHLFFLEISRKAFPVIDRESMFIAIRYWITIVAGAFGAFRAMRLMNPKYYDDILEVWARKWNRKTGEGVL